MTHVRVLVVIYHAILKDDYPDGVWADDNIRQTRFREHLLWYRRRYYPITIDEFLEIQRGRLRPSDFRRPPILLTFDDGHESVFTRGLEVMEELRFPGLVFVLGSVVAEPRNVPWYVERFHMLHRSARGRVRMRGEEYELSDLQQVRRLFELSSWEFEAFGRETSDEDRNAVMDEYAEAFGVPRLGSVADLGDDLRYVSCALARAQARDGLLAVGSHAYSHVNLECLPPERQAWELEESHRVLSRTFPNYRPVLAYPGGSHSPAIHDLARGVYRWGFAVHTGERDSGTCVRNAFAYPRYGLIGWDADRLAYILSRRRICAYWRFKSLRRMAREVRDRWLG